MSDDRTDDDLEALRRALAREAAPAPDPEARARAMALALENYDRFQGRASGLRQGKDRPAGAGFLNGVRRMSGSFFSRPLLAATGSVAALGPRPRRGDAERAAGRAAADRAGRARGGCPPRRRAGRGWRGRDGRCAGSRGTAGTERRGRRPADLRRRRSDAHGCAARAGSRPLEAGRRSPRARPSAGRQRGLRECARQSAPRDRRGSRLDLLDRRGYGKLRDPPLEPAGRAASPARGGADRGDDQLLPVRLPGAGERNAALPPHPLRHPDALEPGDAARPCGAAGPDARHRGPAAAEPRLPDRHVGLDAGSGEAAAPQAVVRADARPPAPRGSGGHRDLCRLGGRGAGAHGREPAQHHPLRPRPARCRRIDRGRGGAGARLPDGLGNGGRGRGHARGAGHRRRLQPRDQRPGRAGPPRGARARHRHLSLGAGLRARQSRRCDDAGAGAERQRAGRLYRQSERGAEGSGRPAQRRALSHCRRCEGAGGVEPGPRRGIPAHRLRDPRPAPRGFRQRPGRCGRDRRRPCGDGDLRDHAGGQPRAPDRSPCATAPNRPRARMATNWASCGCATRRRARAHRP